MTASLSIAGTLVRRRIRRAFARPKRTALTVALFVVPVLPFVLPGEFGGLGASLDGGAVTADGESIRLDPLYEVVFSLFWLLLFVGAAFNVESDVGEFDAGDLLVRAGGVRATVRGHELAGHARRLALFGIWFAVGAGTIALGGGGIAVLPVGAVGVPAVIAVAGASVLAFEAGCVAVAVGTIIPNADASDVAASDGVTIPSGYAVAAYLPAVAVVLTPLLAAALLGGTTVALLAGTAASVALGVVGVAIAVRIAAPRFERFVLD